jgi:hypothetical protein
MTRARSPGSGSPSDPKRDPEGPSTLRSIEAAKRASQALAPADDESPVLPVYYEPQPLVAVSDHKTLEMETVRLAQDIDPRRLPTELRLPRAPRVVPDSDWPQADVVAVSSQPPVTARRNWRTPLVLLVLLGALTLLALAIVTARRAPTAQTPSAAVPSETNLPTPTAAVVPPSPTPELLVPSAPESPPVEVAPAVATAEAPASTSSVLGAAPEPAAAKHAPPLRGSVKSDLHLGSDPGSSRALAVPTVNKPKRAIY